ncbi:hypothetical protein ACHAQH_009796 [Verticillium albo-atrum]
MASVSVSPQVYVSHEFDSAGETDDSWQHLGSHYASGCSNPNSYFINSPGSSLQSYVNIASGAPSASAPGSGAGSPMISRLSPPYHLHPQSNAVPFRAQTETPPTSYLAHPGDAAAVAAAYAFPAAAATSPPMPTAAGVSVDGDIDITMAIDFMSEFPADALGPFLDPEFYPPQQQYDMPAYPLPFSPFPIMDTSYQASHQAPIQQQHDQHDHQQGSSPPIQRFNFNNAHPYQLVDQSAQSAWTSGQPPLQPQEAPAAKTPKAPKAPNTRDLIIHESPYSKDPSLHRPNAGSSTASSVPRREHNRAAVHPSRKAKPAGVQKTKKPTEKNSFVVVTSEQANIFAAAGRLDCFDGGLRTTQRGRKGPLATSTKEAALEVRRVGACFCCKSRKVRCDAAGTCKNCKKIRAGTPQVVCWRFPEFIPVLFPDFMRTHLRRGAMAEFMMEHLGPSPHFSETHQIELSSGDLFRATLVLKALTFKPMDENAHHGWHTQIKNDQVQLYKQDSVPLLLDLETGSQKDVINRKIKEYISALSTEPKYAEQITEKLDHTSLPKKILNIVQTYAKKTDSLMVKKALSICTAHYVLMHQLLFRNQGALRRTTLSMPSGENPTSVVLNRQLKVLVDELLAREVSALFDMFNKSLKPKSKREWTPCLAAFLVLCIFMEDMERATDMFVLSKNEISLRAGRPRLYTRKKVLEVNEQVEKMPFQQFVWQFHHIYQTHSKEHGTKAFNPLMDDASFTMAATDGGVPAAELIKGIRGLVGPDCKYPV